VTPPRASAVRVRGHRLWVTLLDVIVEPGVPGSRGRRTRTAPVQAGREAFEERGYDAGRVDDVRADADE